MGAGAACLATAIFTRRLHPRTSVVLLDGASRPGAKILVSGGGRCNVTNTIVSDADFWGGRRTVIRRVLRGFPVADTIAFFSEIGVRLHEEPGGKLFPDSNKARDVLNALVDEAARTGVVMMAGVRVTGVARDGDQFRVATRSGDVRARRVVLATGGRSLPKSGSDGAGFEMARAFGHTIVPTTPGLVPLVLEDERAAMHRQLSGVSHEAELALWVDGAIQTRLQGSLLWTHFGISGPLALNMSRHWLRARLDERRAELTVSFAPGGTFEDVDARWTSAARERPQTSVSTHMSTLVPASVAAALVDRLGIDGSTTLAHLSRDDRRQLSHALVKWPLPVKGDRGYNYAEVTAGGVSLDEIDPATLRSRVCPGLYLVGEIQIGRASCRERV